jgi:hypothetical protein
VRKREFSLPILEPALLAFVVQMFGAPHAPDRNRWRWETKGRPLHVAQLFRAWLASEEPDPRLGQALATDASWPTWEQMPLKRRQEMARSLLHWLDNVYYPADGMAYVYCPLLHPDQDEPIEIPPGGVYPDPYVITLVQEDGDWRIHSIGLRNQTSPQALGREPYS